MPPPQLFLSLMGLIIRRCLPWREGPLFCIYTAQCATSSNNRKPLKTCSNSTLRPQVTSPRPSLTASPTTWTAPFSSRNTTPFGDFRSLQTRALTVFLSELAQPTSLAVRLIWLWVCPRVQSGRRLPLFLTQSQQLLPMSRGCRH
jgi:hypothetical protein